MRLLVAMVVVLLAATPSLAEDVLGLDPIEVQRVIRHGPWPPAVTRDPSNAVSGHPAAIALGQRLFFDARLSVNGAISCATCHVPSQGWTDGRPRAVGLVAVDRNTPTVLDVALNRWFSWDGRADSLWSQSMKPIVDPREMGASPEHVAKLLRRDASLACLYRKAFGAAPPGDAERALVHVGKSLAAFLETLRSGRTTFDDFRDALARGDLETAARYPEFARKGARIFVGSGRCHLCHAGPAFTNGEFHDVGVPYALGQGHVDTGRFGGIKQVRADRFNLLGPWNDDRTGAAAVKTRHVESTPASFGQFKTPSLRNVDKTAPYMHDGRYATLDDVVRHYSDLNMERIHTHGEQLLRPLKLSSTASTYMAAFLESLTAADTARVPSAPFVAGCRRD